MKLLSVDQVIGYGMLLQPTESLTFGSIFES